MLTGVEVDRSAAEVFACATDATRFSEWQKGHAASPCAR